MATDVTQVPTGNESLSGWTSMAYAAVDDPVASPDGNSTQGYTTANATATFTFPAFSIPAGNIINYVTVYVRCQVGSGGNFNIRGRFKINGSYYEGANIGVTNASWATFSQQFLLNPETGSAWALADVNGSGAHPLQAFGLGASCTSGILGVTQVYILVNYSPAPPSFMCVGGGIFRGTGVSCIVG